MYHKFVLLSLSGKIVDMQMICVTPPLYRLAPPPQQCGDESPLRRRAVSEDCLECVGDRRKYFEAAGVCGSVELINRANRTIIAPIRNGGPGMNCQSNAAARSTCC